MDWMALVDGSSAAVVIGGTAVATLLRCGWSDCVEAGRSLAQLGQTRFDADAVRSELAVQVQEIQRDGLLRAPHHHFEDPEFEEATGALFERRSVSALLEAHEMHRARRVELSHRAVRTFAQAAELAPVFGLAGTLVSLSQLPAGGVGQGAMASAISMAVTTTLYGLLLANLVLAPLARVVSRAANAEETGRQEVIDWIAAQLSTTNPPRRRPSELEAA